MTPPQEIPPKPSWSVSRELKLTDIASVLLTLCLVGITGWYAKLTADSVRASEEMAEQMQRQNAINLRPYLVIEELGDEQINAIAKSDPRNPPGLAKGRGYTILQSAAGDENLLYGVRNVGNVPAHDARHEVRLVLREDSTGEETEIVLPAPPSPSRETLLPNQSVTRSVKIPAGTFISTRSTARTVLTHLKVTYMGVRGVDPNTYYYSVTLRSQVVADVDEMNRGFGRVTIHASDEGIKEREGTAK